MRFSTLYETVRLKILKWRRIRFAKKRNTELQHKDFTIISNNCWGGMIYESYNLLKESPTVGLFFAASDYIRFLSKLKEYIEDASLNFIDPEDSRWKDMVSQDSRFGHYPIGVLKLDDSDPGVEIFFLHYKDQAQALEKWNRRCKRINWNNLIVKFNDQNGCTKDDLINFMRLDYKHKLFFTCKDWKVPMDSHTLIIRVRQLFEKKNITASHEPFGNGKYINITEYINESMM